MSEGGDILQDDKGIQDYCTNLSLLNTLSFWGLTVAASLDRSDADNSLMHSSLNAVVLLDVQLRHGVVLEGRGILDISEGRGINNVSKGKLETI